MSQKNDSVTESQNESILLDRRRVLKAGIGMLITAPAIASIANAQTQSTGQAQGEENSRSNTPTLLIASHPYPERSVVTKALQQTAQNTPGVTVRNLESLYGHDTRAFNVQAERDLYRHFNRVVFLFPIHWFNLTPMLKAYMNEIWTGWAPGSLQGKEMLVVTTAGASENMYAHQGRIRHTIEEVLTPLEASAYYAGMTYLPPLAFLGVAGIDEAKLRSYQQQLSQRLNAA